MITVYRVFQLIMGIIISGFVFYLLLNFAGDYASLGRQGNVQKTLDVFLQDADSVYISGNPSTFTAFSRQGYETCQPRPTRPPKLWCYIEEKSQESGQLLIPVLLRAGDETLLSRGSLDYGWTRWDYVLALPQLNIVFNPRDTSDATWRLIGELAGQFPDTSGFSQKVTFDFCDGSNLVILSAMGEPYERREFLGVIGTNRDAFSECTAPLSQSQFLVTISDSCTQSFAQSGLCVRPPEDGAGRAYITGSPDEYVYKDPADLVALITGGQGMNMFGNPVGEEQWDFKNQFMLSELDTRAEVMERRCEWLVQLDSSSISQGCKGKYQELMASMSRIRDLCQGDYMDLGDMKDLRQALEESEQIWSGLKTMGCESHA